MEEKLFYSMFPFIRGEKPKAAPPPKMITKKDKSFTNRYAVLTPEEECLLKCCDLEIEEKNNTEILRKSVLSAVVGEKADQKSDSCQTEETKKSSDSVSMEKRKKKKAKSQKIGLESTSVGINNMDINDTEETQKSSDSVSMEKRKKKKAKRKLRAEIDKVKSQKIGIESTSDGTNNTDINDFEETQESSDSVSMEKRKKKKAKRKLKTNKDDKQGAEIDKAKSQKIRTESTSDRTNNMDINDTEETQKSSDSVSMKRRKRKAKRKLKIIEDDKQGAEIDKAKSGGTNNMDIDDTEDVEDGAPAAKKAKGEKTNSKTIEDAVEKKKKNLNPQAYVLFVGNLPYDVTKEQLVAHFEKAGKVLQVRIPLTKEANKPRGFAYVEVPDETSFELALSLHHSFMKGRRINVEYTMKGKGTNVKRRQLIKKKNLKLQALVRTGKFGHTKNKNRKRYRK